MTNINLVASPEQIGAATLVALRAAAEAHISASNAAWLLERVATGRGKLTDRPSPSVRAGFVKLAYQGVAESLDRGSPFVAALEQLKEAALQRVLREAEPNAPETD